MPRVVMRARYWDYEPYESGHLRPRDGEYDPTTYKGVGWVTKDGKVTHARAQAMEYGAEAEAWEHAAAAGLVGWDEEDGDWCWVEVEP